MRVLSGFLLLGSSLICVSHDGYAVGNLASLGVDTGLRSFVGLTLGAEFTRTGHTQTLSLLPPF